MSKKSFYLDLKFTSQDVIFNAEQIVGKLSLRYDNEINIAGNMYDVVLVNKDKIYIKQDNSNESLDRIIDLINQSISDKFLRFEQVITIDGNYEFELVKIPKKIPQFTPILTPYYGPKFDTTEQMYEKIKCNIYDPNSSVIYKRKSIFGNKIPLNKNTN